MARPKGQSAGPGLGKPTGRPPEAGHRKALDEWRGGLGLTGAAAERLKVLQRVYREQGPRVIMKQLACETAELALTLYTGCKGFEEKLEREGRLDDKETLRRYSATAGNLALQAFKMFESLGERDGDVIDYEQILAEERRREEEHS